ncbi:MAG TPA: glutaredoxin family protein [Bacteroidota bacterium]|jgi:glutaredoxin|nr:glutaredoxin family protein [Bacteroidota bacterium]
MNLVELYSKDECTLCDRAKEVLVAVQRRYPFDLQEVKIREGDEFYEIMKERIPVVYINKKFAFQHRVPEKELIAILAARS